MVISHRVLIYINVGLRKDYEYLKKDVDYSTSFVYNTEVEFSTSQLKGACDHLVCIHLSLQNL